MTGSLLRGHSGHLGLGECVNEWMSREMHHEPTETSWWKTRNILQRHLTVLCLTWQLLHLHLLGLDEVVAFPLTDKKKCYYLIQTQTCWRTRVYGEERAVEWYRCDDIVWTPSAHWELDPFPGCVKAGEVCKQNPSLTMTCGLCSYVPGSFVQSKTVLT